MTSSSFSPLFPLRHSPIRPFAHAQKVRVNLKNGATITSTPAAPVALFSQPYVDPVAQFGAGEYYAHEAEFFGQRAHGATLTEATHDQV